MQRLFAATTTLSLAVVLALWRVAGSAPPDSGTSLSLGEIPAPLHLEAAVPRAQPSARLAPSAFDASRPEPDGPRIGRHEPPARVAVDVSAFGEAVTRTEGIEAPLPGSLQVAPGGTTESDDDSIPRLMYCHPDSRGPLDAADVLQDCVDRAPAFSSIEIPPGVYVLHRQVVVRTPVTIRTAGSANTMLSCRDTPGQCAILAAGPDLIDRFGLVMVRDTNNVTFEHLVLDGNRDQRLSSVAARWCQLGRNQHGFNAAFIGCSRCMLDDLVSRNALCGTAMVWSGAGAIIRRSEFSANGDARTSRMWADGLTLVYAPDSDIRDNRFIDNSDIGMILGQGVRTRVEYNVVVQRRQPVFAGLMLDNFNSDNLNAHGDFRGAVIANNIVDCGARLCVFGIQVGPGPWYPSRNIVGGELFDNRIVGAKVGINVDGAGARRDPTAIFRNTVLNVPSGAFFSDCVRAIPTEWMNVSPSSFIDRRDDVGPTGASLSDPCQFWSDVE